MIPSSLGRQALTQSAKQWAHQWAHHRRLQALAWISATASVLCLVALFNGQPFFYPDTSAYVRGAQMGLTKLFGERLHTDLLPSPPTTPRTSPQGPRPAGGEPAPDGPPPAPTAKGLTSMESGIVLAGRSVYYGALLYLGYVTGGFWLTVVIQALAVAWVLHLLLVRQWGLKGPALLMTATGLSLLTPLGAFTGFLMPDIFASLVILTSVALYLHWATWSRGERALLALILLVGLVSHASHVVLALLLWVGLGFAGRRWLRGAAPSAGALIVGAACIGSAFAAEWVFDRAVVHAIGQSPLRLPHLMARQVDAGPGTALLKASCPESGYVACAYVDNFPTDWELFMFSTDPRQGAFALASPQDMRRFSAEQLPFLAHLITYDPVGVSRVYLSGAVEQLVEFRLSIFNYGTTLLEGFRSKYPEAVYRQMEAARLARDPDFVTAMNRLSYLTVLLAIGVGLLLHRRHGHTGSTRLQQFQSFAALTLMGVIANAVVCGVLAAPYDRFQARVIWLVPLMAAVYALIARQESRRRQVEVRAVGLV